MSKPVLVIMAAGLGSRYGGLKQIDPIDEHGHLIIDFSIYDAIKSGFEKVIFVIKKENEADFRERIGNRVGKHVAVEYVYQDINDLPSGYSVPEGRVKPWGTGHAVLSCAGKVNGPMAVINADDFYGRTAFSRIYDFLINSRDDDKYNYAMVGYILENTLTDHGYVARGVCEISEDGYLVKIKERTRIEKKHGGAAYTEDGGQTWIPLPKGSIVSMNMWGFGKSILFELKQKFETFLKADVPKNPLKAEYFLPEVVGQFINEGKARVKVLNSPDKWYGVTYKEDKEMVVKAISRLKESGLYPDVLWSDK